MQPHAISQVWMPVLYFLANSTPHERNLPPKLLTLYSFRNILNCTRTLAYLMSTYTKMQWRTGILANEFYYIFPCLMNRGRILNIDTNSCPYTSVWWDNIKYKLMALMGFLTKRLVPVKVWPWRGPDHLQTNHNWSSLIKISSEPDLYLIRTFGQKMDQDH